jgi:CamS sex pheromone cAM373 precursor.
MESAERDWKKKCRKAKWVAAMLLFVLLAGGCVPSNNNGEQIIEEGKNEEQKTVRVPKYQISDSYYKVIAPFEPSDTRGMVLNNLSTRYDSDAFEEGLLRIAQKRFSTDEYLFRDGKYIDAKTVKEWLSRKSANENDGGSPNGLNPALEENSKAGYEKSPKYLAHLLEHDYLLRTKDNKVKTGGVVIGLALNSVYTYSVNGESGEVKISDAKLKEEGKRMANEVLKRLRHGNEEDLKSVPIVIALYKQREKTAVIPGNFIAYGVSEKGTELEWEDVNEEYVLFPSDDAMRKYRGDAEMFSRFQDEITSYFPNYNGIVGRGLYIDEKLVKLKIDIHYEFYGKAETIGFAQYIGGLVGQMLPGDADIEVRVESLEGPEALIIKNEDRDEPFVYIY